MKTSFTQEDILNQLEAYDQETYHFFIDLEHPYFHTASSRLTLYGDSKRWAIVFEKSGYSNSGDRGEIELEYFGNCLINLLSEGSPEGYTSNMQTIILISTPKLKRIENDTDELVAANIKQVKVRDNFLNIEHDKTKYEQKGIRDTVYDNPGNLIDFPSLIRYLAEEHPSLFRATDRELRKCLPDDLPKLMQIDQWHHERYYQGSGAKPSSYETYRMIADILVTRDTTKWKPTLMPNNDWRNWPNAGYM